MSTCCRPSRAADPSPFELWHDRPVTRQAGDGPPRKPPLRAAPVSPPVASPVPAKPDRRAAAKAAPGRPPGAAAAKAVTKAAVQKGAVAKAAVAKPPVAKPPVAKPPVAKAPVAKAPVTRAPAAKSPATRAPVTRAGGTRTAAAKAPAAKAAPRTAATAGASPAGQVQGGRTTGRAGGTAGHAKPGRPKAAHAAPGQAKAGASSIRRPRETPQRGGGRPVGRASLSADPLARDWADTGDPEYEPDLDNADPGGAGRRGDAGRPPRPMSPARNEPPRTFWNGPPRFEESTVVLPRPAFDEPPPDVAPRQAPRGRRPARRAPMIVQGLWPALLAGGLAAATSFGLLPLAVAVLAVQVFLILGALALLDAPAAGGAFVVVSGAVVAADAVVLLGEGSISQLSGVVGVGLVAALVHQLARRDRSRVTESLADTLVVLVVAVGASCLLAFHDMPGGEAVLQVSLASAGAVLLVGRLGDLLSARPILAVGSTRGWPGLLLGLASGVAAGGGVAFLVGEPPVRAAALLGLVVASTVATADLAVDLGAAELRSGWRDARRVAALRPTALLLPYAVLGPVALLAGRLLLT